MPYTGTVYISVHQCTSVMSDTDKCIQSTSVSTEQYLFFILEAPGHTYGKNVLKHMWVAGNRNLCISLKYLHRQHIFWWAYKIHQWLCKKERRKPLRVISFVAFNPQKVKYMIVAKFTLTSDSKNNTGDCPIF